MTMELVPTKRLELYAGRSHSELAQEIADHLGVALQEANLKNFPNGEIHCRFGDSVRGTDVFILQTHGEPVNDSIMEQLIMIDAAKRASAKRITAVCPYYGYSRQDRKVWGREPITAKLVADMLRVAGANRIMSVDLHSGQIQGFFDGPVDHLLAMPVLIDYLRDPGGTVCAAAELLAGAGATEVWAMATHGILSDPAIDRLKNSVISRVVITNTLPLAPDRLIDKLEVLSVSSIIADAIDAVFEDT